MQFENDGDKKNNAWVDIPDGMLMVQYSNCHSGNVVIYTAPSGARLMAGGKTRGAVEPPGGIVIDLDPRSGELEPAVPPIELEDGLESIFTELAELLDTASKPASYILIEAGDYQPLPLTKPQFEALAVGVHRALAAGIDVLVVCMGGHGRTGQLAAALLHYLEPSAECPVTRLRRLYCENAVENIAQIRWVESVTGIQCPGVTGSRVLHKPVGTQVITAAHAAKK